MAEKVSKGGGREVLGGNLRERGEHRERDPTRVNSMSHEFRGGRKELWF